MYLGISEDVSRAKTNNSLKFHRAAPRLSAQMYLVLSKSGTRGNTDMRIAAYPFDLPSVRQRVDIQDTLLFSKPDGGLDRSAISFITLQVEISLTRKWVKALARHSNTFLLGTVGMLSCHSVPGMRILPVQPTAVGDREGGKN